MREVIEVVTRMVVTRMVVTREVVYAHGGYAREVVTRLFLAPCSTEASISRLEAYACGSKKSWCAE